MPHVLVADHPSGVLDLERAMLEPKGYEIVVAPDTEIATLCELTQGAVALMVCYAHIPETVIAAAAAGGVKVIARYGVGYDNIDVRAAARQGIPVTYVPDYCIAEVADHTIALMLSALRGLQGATRVTASGGWSFPRGALRRLQGQRLAVIGNGRIGQAVIARTEPFGFETVVFDPNGSPGRVRCADTLEDAIVDADVITLHCPLLPTTHHLLGGRQFAEMKRSPLVVNTSRGGLIDLDAAVDALDSGNVSALALDVTEVEPLPHDHVLRRREDVTLTPHMAFYSVESERELQQRATQDVLRVLDGLSPSASVSSDVSVLG